MLTAQADREFFNFLFKLNTYILNFIFLCFLLSRWALQRGERVFNLRNWSWRRRRRWPAGRDAVDNYLKKYNKYKYLKVKQQIHMQRKANTILLSWSWIRRRRWRAGRDVVDKYVKNYNIYKYLKVKQQI